MIQIGLYVRLNLPDNLILVSPLLAPQGPHKSIPQRRNPVGNFHGAPLTVDAAVSLRLLRKCLGNNLLPAGKLAQAEEQQVAGRVHGLELAGRVDADAVNDLVHQLFQGIRVLFFKGPYQGTFV